MASRIRVRSNSTRWINGIRLENFKGYKDSGLIPLSQLTIVVGKNSSGKSSLIKSILSMAQTARSPLERIKDTGSSESDLNLNGELTNLGTFTETVHGNNAHKFAISFAMGGANNDKQGQKLDYSYRYSFQRSKESPLQAQFSGLSVSYGEENLLSTSAISKRASGRAIFGLKLNGFKHTEMKRFESYSEELPEIIQKMNEIYRSEHIFNFDENVEDRFSCKIYGLSIKIINEPNLWKKERNSLQEEIFGESERISSILENTLRGAIYVGPLREQPSREARISHSTARDIGVRGQDLPIALYKMRNDLNFMNTLNSHLQKLGIGESIHTSPSYSKNKNGEEIETGYIRTRVIKDGTSRSLMDLGFGTSQILPVIFQLGIARDRLILLEQPELHLHPSAQSELGDILANSLGRMNQIIIETHSANLIARIQRLINQEVLDKDDVNLLYVKSEDNLTTCKSIGFYDDGSFDDTWPEDDFFTSLEMDILGLD